MADANTCEWLKGELSESLSCKICGKIKGKARHLWYYPTFMNGDAEIIASFCLKDHLPEQAKEYNALKKEIGESDKDRQRRQKDEYNDRVWPAIHHKLSILKQRGYLIRDLTQFQYRINGVLDVYPQNMRYHAIKENQRGDYRDLINFVESFFNKRKETK